MWGGWLAYQIADLHKVRTDDSLDSGGGSGDGGKVWDLNTIQQVKSIRPSDGLDTEIDRRIQGGPLDSGLQNWMAGWVLDGIY